MKPYRLLPLLAVIALAACLPGPAPAATPTAALPTISAALPTTLAAFQLPGTATPQASPTPRPVAAYPALGSPVPFTPLPPAPSIGRHRVQPGETIACIGRAYGVLPAAIAQANGLGQSLSVSAGQVLNIPAVQWTDIPAGAVCAPQFRSPFPGRAMPAGTPAAYPAPGGSPLTIRLNFNCVDNCGAKTGNYTVRLQVLASGGVQPYGFSPAQTYDVSVPHCTTGQGTSIVTSADGQTAQQGWTYHDAACP